MYNPFISVIVPNYNHATFLDERFQSILNQTYQNFELIILDDKSTDNSLEIINKYKDNQHVTHVVVNEINSGSPFKQWNKGLQLAKGDLVWIAESDDSCNNTFLNELVRYFENDSLSLVFCHSKMINCDGDYLPNPFQNSLSESFVMQGKQFIVQYLLNSNVIENASSVLFTKKASEDVNKDFIYYFGAGDWLFWIEIARRGYVGYLNKELNYFRWHGNNTTIKKNTSGENEFEVKKIYDYLLNQHIISHSEFNSIRRAKLYSIYHSSIFSNDIKKRLLKEWGIDISFQLRQVKEKIYNLVLKIFR